MSVIIDGTNGITFPDTSRQYNSYYNFKNRIINGGMVIDQRNNGASVTPTSGQYTLDRWASWQSAASKYSVQQNAGSVTPPAGFNGYLGITSLSAYSVSASDAFFQYQPIEGFNFADLAWGTANAQTVTLSFWVRSSLTGTFGGAFVNSAGNRSYPFSYTISAANTWEQKSIVIAGDTTGTWVGATNGIGVNVRFGLGSGSTFSGTAGAWAAGNFVQPTGSVSVVGTNGATFYITGVQLEEGIVSTPFDFRPYGTELQLCQRYYETYGGSYAFEPIYAGYVFSTTQGVVPFIFNTVKRAAPTLTISAASDWGVLNSSGSTLALTALIINGSGADVTPKSVSLRWTVASGMVAGNGTVMTANNTTNARMNFSAEL